jgi:hypothetical protein
MTEAGTPLEAAYRDAEYQVWTGRRWISLRIGHASEPADRQLRRRGVRHHWAIVTPCNPGSRRLPVAANAARLRSCKRRLLRLHVRFAAARNRDPHGRWPDEPGFLLCDPPLRRAAALGLAFGQRAIVTGRSGAAPQLLWLSTSAASPPHRR